MKKAEFEGYAAPIKQAITNPVVREKYDEFEAAMNEELEAGSNSIQDLNPPERTALAYAMVKAGCTASNVKQDDVLFDAVDAALQGI